MTVIGNSKKTRTTYSTNIKLAASFDILTKKVEEQIPKSTLHRFKNTDYSYVFGVDFKVNINGGKSGNSVLFLCYLTSKAEYKILPCRVNK